MGALGFWMWGVGLLVLMVSIGGGKVLHDGVRSSTRILSSSFWLWLDLVLAMLVYVLLMRWGFSSCSLFIG